MNDGFTGFPFGLGIAMMINSNSRNDYDRLSETEKEHIILKCKDARSKDEVDRIVNTFAGNDAGDLIRDAEIR